MVTLAVFAQPALARSFGEIYKECGLGGMIFTDNGDAAAVSNIVWDSGTTAISSNITTPDSCKGGQARMAAFINESYEAIEEDLASGEGTYLDTLMVLAGVDEVNKDQLAAAIRVNFAGIVADAGYTDQSRVEKSEALYGLVYKLIEV